MIPAISSAAALFAAHCSEQPVAPQGETFQNIFNDVVPLDEAADALDATATRAVPTNSVGDVAESFLGLAKPAPAAANPALASAIQSEPTSDEPMDESNVLMTQVPQLTPEMSVPQVIAAAAKAITPQTEIAKQTENSTPQPTGSAIAALTPGRNERRQRLSAPSQKAANDVPLVPKNETRAAVVAADLPMLDAAPDVAVAPAPASPSTFQASPSVAVSTPDVRQLYLTPDNQWIDTLRNEIVSSPARDNQLQFTLKPEHLGKLDVILTTQDGKVDIRFDTSTSAAAQMLATEQVQLLESLRQAGVKVGQFEMTNGQDGARQQQRQQQDTETSDPQSTPRPNTLSNEMRGRFDLNESEIMSKHKTSSEPGSSPKKRKKLIIGAVIGLGLIAAGATTGVYLAGGIASKTPEIDPLRPMLVERSKEPEPPAEAGAEAEPLLKEGTIAVKHDRVPVDPRKYEVTYVGLEQSFTANLADGAGFVQLGLSLATYYDGRVVQNIQRQSVPIRSAVLMVLSQQDAASLSTPQGKQLLQRDLTAAINQVLREKEGFGGVENVYFSNLVIQ